jgi:hypothetical protein
MAAQLTQRSNGLTRMLGGASLALGMSELIAPDRVASIAGVPATARTRSVIRALGARECGHAAAVLLGPPRMVWTRVAGDVLDVALLVRGLSTPGARRGRGAVTALVLAVIGAADVYAGLRARDEKPPRHASEIEPRHRADAVRPQHGGVHLAE